MAKTAKQKWNLGVLVVVSTTLLILALYFIGKRQHLFQNNIILRAEFHNVNGLQVGNNVRFSGIDAGTVSDINMTSDSTILVEMRIRKETMTFIHKNAIASIGSDGLVGNMIVNITPKKGNAFPVITGDTLQTSNKIATDDMLSTLSVTNQNAALLTEDLLQITSQIIEGEGTLALLLNDPQTAKDLQESVAQIKRSTALASKSLSEIQQFSKLLHKEGTVAYTLFSDSLSGNSMQNAIKNVEVSSEQLVDVTQQLQSFLTKVENSKGTLNYVINDTLLPKDIEATISEIKQSSERLNENMKALQHNILFRGYFRKLERKARKEAKNKAD
jgi:phospholipid/cholesterol/gamma-HCH transport system substrate-binding protein